MRGARYERDAAKALSYAVRRVPRANPEPDLKRRAGNAPLNPYKLGLGENTHKAAGLLQCKQTKGITNESGDASLFAAKAVKEEVEDQ